MWTGWVWTTGGVVVVVGLADVVGGARIAVGPRPRVDGGMRRLSAEVPPQAAPAVTRAVTETREARSRW